MKYDTSLLHGNFKGDAGTGATLVPVYQSSAFGQETAEQIEKIFHNKAAGFAYTRISNPTTASFENRITYLEGGIASVAVSSGMAAISATFLNILSSGDEIISKNSIFGGTLDLFKDFENLGIKIHLIDEITEDEMKKYVNENTKAVFIETLGNPNSNIIDIEKVARIAHRHNIPLIVDNTFATPYLVRPIEYGADIVVHSATKFIGGHGTSLGGVIVDSGNFDWNASGKFPTLTEPDPGYHGISFAEAAGAAAFVTRIRAVLLRDTGAALSPFNAFLLLQGLETLSLRVERHTLNAVKAVNYLKDHPKVNRVNHPSISDNGDPELYKKYFPNGGGSIFTFEIKGGEAEAKRFIDSLELFSLLANVADAKSLVIHPASTTHSQLSEKELLKQNIKPNTIRLSIGIEHIDDIINDLSQAFDKI